MTHIHINITSGLLPYLFLSFFDYFFWTIFLLHGDTSAQAFFQRAFSCKADLHNYPMVSHQKRLAIRQRNSFSGMLLMMLQAPPSHQKSLHKSSIKNIISSSRSAETGTAIFIQAEKNISLDEISEHDMKRIFYYRHLRKMQNHSLIGK